MQATDKRDKAVCSSQGWGLKQPSPILKKKGPSAKMARMGQNFRGDLLFGALMISSDASKKGVNLEGATERSKAWTWSSLRGKPVIESAAECTRIHGVQRAVDEEQVIVLQLATSSCRSQET